MNHPTYEEFGIYTVVTHTTGRNRFAVWRNLHTAHSEEICWCAEKEVAFEIVDALRRRV
jgi:hypothetical protein